MSLFLFSLNLASMILSRISELLSKHPEVAIKSRSDPFVIPVIVSFFLVDTKKRVSILKIYNQKYTLAEIQSQGGIPEIFLYQYLLHSELESFLLLSFYKRKNNKNYRLQDGFL